jgi:hypothetical protein
MSDVRHERHFGDFRGTSAYPPRLAVKADIPDRQVCATTRREQSQQDASEKASPTYSITSSASASSVGGISRPIVLAVCRLMTNSNLLTLNTGRSAGPSPLRMRPV